jgi:hypothetical protein
MNPDTFLSECQRRGYRLSLRGDNVRVSGRDLPKRLIPYLSKHKPEIVEILRGKPTETPREACLGEKVIPNSPYFDTSLSMDALAHISCAFDTPDDFGTFTDQRTGAALTASGVWYLIETDDEPTLTPAEWVLFSDWFRHADAMLLE